MLRCGGRGDAIQYTRGLFSKSSTSGTYLYFLSIPLCRFS